MSLSNHPADGDDKLSSSQGERVLGSGRRLDDQGSARHFGVDRLTATRGRSRTRDVPLSVALDAAGIAAIAAAATMGFEEIRVFLSYLVWTVGETASTPVLGLFALTPFLAISLGGLVLRLLGPRRGLLLATAWLVAAYLAEKTSASPPADLALSGLALVCWGWSLVGAVVVLRRGVALGLVLGGALDLAIRIGFVTIDLPWTDDPLATVVGGGLATAALVGTRQAVLKAQNTGEVGWRGLGPLLGLGPWLALTMLVTGNLSQAMLRAGSDFGVMAGALAVGHAAGVRLVAGAAARPTLLPGLTALSSLGMLALVPLWNGWSGGPIWGAIVAAAASVLLAACFRPTEDAAIRASADGSAFILAAALTIFVGVVYIFYAVYGPHPLMAGIAVGLVAGSVAGAGLTLFVPEQVGDTIIWPANVVAVLALALGTYRAISWSDRVARDPAPEELTAMTYNIRVGFGADGRWDLERTARAIEAEASDVIVLQEITRGWIIAAGADEAVWLSQRLGMPYVFGPGAGDLHGNLLLSRYQISGSAHQYSASTATSLPRGAIDGQLETDRGPLVVLGTHFDHPAEAAAVRQAQATELVGRAGDRRPVLILGDLNAETTSVELRPFAEAGYVDVAARHAVFDPTWPTRTPVKRIDHILATPDLSSTAARVSRTEASDHLPLVARLRMP